MRISMKKEKGSLRLVLGGSGYGKSGYIFEQLIEMSVKNPDKNYIIVVPEQFTMQTQKEIVERHPNHGVLNIDIVSFNRLAFRVFEELGISNLSVLDDTGKTLILKRIIEENRDRLNIYKSKVNKPGFVEEMKSAISELYSYGIGTEEFDNIAAMTKDRPYIASKLEDIRLIYDAFKTALGEKYITKEEILDKLCAVIDKSEIVKNSSFVFDGFTGFTPVQNKLLGLMLEEGRKIMITVTISAEEALKLTKTGFAEIKEQELFNLSKTTINKLFALAADRQVTIEKDDIIVLGENYRHRQNKELAYLEKNIFRNVNRKCENTGNIKLLPMANPMEEVEFAATYINDLVRNNGFRYRDFAVITGGADNYRNLIDTVFVQNEIPYFMDNKRRLILNPCVVAIRSAIEMIRDNFSYESVFAFLKCNMSGIDRAEIDILENYVLEYGIRGYKAYSQPFVKLKNKKKEYLLETVNDIRERFINLVDDFKTGIGEKDKTVKELTESVYTFTEKLGIYEVLKEYEEQFTKEGKLSLAKEYSQTYGFIIELLDKLVELMGDTKVSIKEYGRLLDAGFEEIKVGVIPLNIDNVVIGDIERTRLTDVKILFVIGVNDGIIPKTGVRNGLLTERDRGFLKRLEVELSPTSRESIFIQRFYLYQNLTKPSDKLILTYSLSSAEGRPARPSYLIDNITDMYTDRKLLSENVLKENIFTKHMGLKYLSENFVNADGEQSRLIKELYTYFYTDEAFKDKLMKIVAGAYFNENADTISSAVAGALYGEDVVKSASRLEKYAACAYSHFLSYGLKLAERKIYEISAADIGTIYHNIIEMFSKEMTKHGLSYRDITEVQREKLLDECIKNIEGSVNGDLFLDTSRNRALLKRIKEVSSKTIWAISEHIKAGNFNPEDFEMSFSDGRVDRVDSMEADDRYYVKIIDYKSGSKKFDIEDVMNGLQIQLIYYMGGVMDVEKEKHKDSVVMPAGAFYFNIKSPYIERIPLNDKDDKEEAYREALLAEYRMTGLVNSDSEAVFNMDTAMSDGAKSSMIIPIKADELNIGMGKNSMGSINFTRIIEYVRNKTEKMCDEILAGNIKANPYIKGITTPCTYCSYKGLCTFNEKYSGNKFRKLDVFEPEDIYKKIGGENNGSDLD